MFQARHYVAIAKALDDAIPQTRVQQKGWERAVHQLCNLFEQDNPAFDRDRFLFACVKLNSGRWVSK